MKNKTLITFTMILALFVFSFDAYAAYPEQPIQIMIGHAAGGSTDVVARTFAAFLSKYLKSPVVVNNMPGGGGRVMLNHVNSQPANGYTLCMVVTPSYLNVQLLNKTKWDLNKFTYLGGVGGGDSNGLIVSYDSAINSLADLVAASQKGPVTMAGTSVGSNSWLMAVMLKQYVKGFNYDYVPYDSGNKATMAIVGGHVTTGIASTINFPDLLKEKKIKILGVAAEKRLETLPDVITMSELGYPQVKVETKQVLAGPPGLPKDVTEILISAVKQSQADPEFAKLSVKQGFTVDPTSAPETLKSVNDSYGVIKKVLEETGQLK